MNCNVNHILKPNWQQLPNQKTIPPQSRNQKTPRLASKNQPSFAFVLFSHGFAATPSNHTTHALRFQCLTQRVAITTPGINEFSHGCSDLTKKKYVHIYIYIHTKINRNMSNWPRLHLTLRGWLWRGSMYYNQNKSGQTKKHNDNHK